MSEPLEIEFFDKGECDKCGHIIFEPAKKNKYQTGHVGRNQHGSVWQWACRGCGTLYHEVARLFTA